MICYRTYRRHRYRQKCLFTILMLIICLFGLILFQQIHSIDELETMYPLQNDSSLKQFGYCYCSQSALIIFEHGECFFDHPICYPGFTGNTCQIRITNETYRAHCPLDVYRTEWTSHLTRRLKLNCTKSLMARQEWNSSCLFLCFYHRLTGTIQIPDRFWHKSLANEFSFWQSDGMAIDDRLHEHVQGFHGYKILPLNIPSIVEIGAGPFTQIQYLLTPFRSIKRITLIEPNALNYMKLNNCAYRGGHLRGFPVSIVSESIETVIKQRRQSKTSSLERYSIVVSINVVEHVHDALEYFRGLYDLLDDHGLLVFHERWYDTPQEGDCVLYSAEDLHPIRITKWILDRFLEQFDALHVNYNRSTRQLHNPCREKGVYFIGRKKSKCSA